MSKEVILEFTTDNIQDVLNEISNKSRAWITQPKQINMEYNYIIEVYNDKNELLLKRYHKKTKEIKSAMESTKDGSIKMWGTQEPIQELTPSPSHGMF